LLSVVSEHFVDAKPWKDLYHIPVSLMKTQVREQGGFCMEFCPSCGCFLAPAKVKVENETLLTLTCSKCGYQKPISGAATPPKTERRVQSKSKPSITVISEEDQKIQTMPTIKVECPKCGNHLVFVWQVQTRGGDEASTQFMRCTKCSHTFREYT